MTLSKVVTDPADLPQIPEARRVCFDVETISFDDREPALNPYVGHRIQGLALCFENGDRFYLPVRHRDPAEKLLPMEAYLAFCRDLFMSKTPEEREVFGHNVKFDLRFLRADGIFPTCKVADTMVLARLVENTTQKLGLDWLCQRHGVIGKQGADVKAFTKSFLWTDEVGEEHRGTEDFGRVPVHIMAPYAMRDVSATFALRRVLEGKLPDFSRPLWEKEKEFTKVLADVEHDGVIVDVKRLKADQRAAYERLIEISEEINRIAGWEVDPNSENDKTQLLVRQLGIKPTAFTPTGRPQWSKAVLHNLTIPDSAGPDAKMIGRLLQSWSYLTHFLGTYIEGWRSRLGKDGRLHPDLKQAGTITGRLSAGDPNTQNIPVEAERYIVCGPGEAIVAFDFSQIEYRIFADYTDDPTIKSAYEKDPDADFHQHLANMLGVPRQFAKTLNFAFLYGMGKEKLLLSLMAMMTVAHTKGDPEMEEKLMELMRNSGANMAAKAGEYLKGGAKGKTALDLGALGRLGAGSAGTELLRMADEGQADAEPTMDEETIAALSSMVSNTGGQGIIDKGAQFVKKIKEEKEASPQQAATTKEPHTFEPATAHGETSDLCKLCRLPDGGEQHLDLKSKTERAAASMTAEQQAMSADLTTQGGRAMAERARQYVKSDSGMREIATMIYDEYHRQFPSIKAFSLKVAEVAKVRKYVRNKFGRMYDFDMSKYDSAEQRRAFGPHRAVNYLIQGSCADLLRYKMVELHAGPCKTYNARAFMTVHDSIYFYVPRENAAAFFVETKKILETCPEIGVPIRVDGKVSVKSVACDVEVDESGGRAATIADVERALVEAETARETGQGALDASKGYRVGRHGV